ncbi:MAG: hypothetical protein F2900_02260 [Actinobacteria bacterium]|nr:hypothetical protein [Actinomycetota bacterium]
MPSDFRSKIHNFLMRSSGAEFEIAQLKNVIHERENRLHDYVKQALATAASEASPVTYYTRNSNDSKLGQSFDTYGSDKNQRHSYAQFYEDQLDGIESPRILEIGIGSLGQFPYAGLKPGGSLQAWRERYPTSVIVGGDIDEEAFASVSEIAFQLDQTDTDSLDVFSTQIASYGPFDLIVDDGFHDPHANILTVLSMLPLLAPNGSYVIEDVHSSLIDFWRVVLDVRKIHGTVIDMSALRPDTDDNVLVLIKGKQF